MKETSKTCTTCLSKERPILFSFSLFLVPIASLLLASMDAEATARLQVNIVGAGTVDFSPAGTDCGTNCRDFANWTMVTLTPTPGQGWSFKEWQGDGNGSPKRMVFMNNDKAATAIFSQDPGTPALININPEEVINPGILGLGLNFHIMFVPENGQQRQQFYQYLKETGATWLRVVLQYYEWENANNDDSDPWTPPSKFLSADFKGFAWNRGGLHYGLKSLLDMSEQSGIQLEINNWETSKKPWLHPEYYSNPASYPIPYQRFRADAEEFGENLAALVYYLKTKANSGKGYDCVRYWAVWNEPGGGHKGQDFIFFDFPGTMNLLYERVDAHLKKYDELQGTHVHDKVLSIGFESFPFFRDSPQAGHPMNTWEDMIGRGVLQYLEEPDNIPGEITNWPDGDPYMDVIAIHDYWSVLDYDVNNPHDQNQGALQARLLDHLVTKSLQEIRQYDMDGKIEPLFISELGSKPYKNNPPSFTESLYILEGAMRALEMDGVKAVAKWSYNTHYEWSMISYPGFDWETDPKNTVHPVAVNYYPFKLVASRLPHNCDMVKTTILGGIDSSSETETWQIPQAQRLFSAAALTPDGKISVFVFNDSYEQKDIKLKFTHGISSVLERASVSASSYSDIAKKQVHKDQAGSGEFTDRLAPRSIVVYQGNYDSQGRETGPESFADAEALDENLSEPEI
ncbi:MAG: hypothetical protein GXP49_06680, partial [Deltaproteobacteria bacterium]|nr:hypothetical protein [Deltaproteobacteria bacterium]